MTSKKDKELASKMTEARCKTWVKNPLVSPISGATINHKGPTYNIIEKVCREKFNITLSESPKADPSESGPSLNALPKLPKKIDGIEVPQNPTSWINNSLINRDFDKIIEIITNSVFSYISEYVFMNLPSYVELCEVGLKYKLVPESDIEKIRDYKEKFTHYSNKENLNGVTIIQTKYIDIIHEYLEKNVYNFNTERIYTSPLGLNRALEKKANELYEECKKIQLDILNNGVVTKEMKETAKDINNLRNTIIYYGLLYNDINATIDTWNRQHNPINSEGFKKLVTISVELLEFISEIEELDQKRNVKYKSITGKSKSATLPKSISMRRTIIKQYTHPEPAEILDSDGTTYKKRTEGPVNLKEFSDYIEDEKTDRSKFKHHSLLSQMKPLSRESLEALPEKTRIELLTELRLQCDTMKDTFTGKRFDRMAKKNLHLVVQIGPPSKKRCYYVRNIYKYWETVAKANSSFTDPGTRTKVTSAEKADIMHKIKYIKKDALNPDDVYSLRKDPKLEMVIKLDTTGQYYTFHVKRDVGSLTYLIHDLGVLPANIDLTHADGGAAYYSSAATVANIKELFDKGRIMRSNFIPYTCCKMRFKNRSYWSGDIVEVNRKFKLFADEVYSLL